MGKKREMYHENTNWLVTKFLITNCNVNTIKERDMAILKVASQHLINSLTQHLRILIIRPLLLFRYHQALGVPSTSWIVTGDSHKLSFSTLTKVPFLNFWSDKPPRLTNSAQSKPALKNLAGLLGRSWASTGCVLCWQDLHSWNPYEAKSD